jgi:hypothetical protein
VRRYVAWLTAAPRVLPSTPGRARRAGALATRVARVLVPTALLGLIVAAVTAAGSLSQVAQEAPEALVAMALAFPPALAMAFDWPSATRRRLRAAFLAVAGLAALSLILPIPGIDMARAHPVVALLGIASSSAAAGLANVRVAFWRERFSD